MSMTFREKLAKEHPEKKPNNIFKVDCPSEYGYEVDTGDCPKNCDGSPMSCKECWDREIPGSDIEDGVTEEMKQQIIEESVVIQKPDGNLEFKVEQKTMLGTEDMYINTETLPVAKILDSGNRRQFESGAVRDIQEGKGRCDLLPLDVVGAYLRNIIFDELRMFVESGDVNCLYRCLDDFLPHWDDGKTKNGELEIKKQRQSTMILEVSKHFEEGAKKYGENNWQKGIPVHCYIDSAVRHYLKFLRGDKDEPHDRAFCWNIMCAIWTCKHKPELNEYAKVDIPKRDYDPVDKAYDVAKSAYNGDQSNIAYALEEIVGYSGEALDG